MAPLALELFSGVGGMRLALGYAGVRARFVAVDLNEWANAVCAQQHGERGALAFVVDGRGSAVFGGSYLERVGERRVRARGGGEGPSELIRNEMVETLDTMPIDV